MLVKKKDKNGLPETDIKKDKGGVIKAPPLKPFSKKGNNAPSKPGSLAFRPEIPRRVGEIPGIRSRGDDNTPFGDDANCLTVGQNISLNGEITSCDKLVVEGKVEVSLSEAHTIEVASNGYFKGSADVNTADINGHFEGNLLVKDVLTIRKEGRITGSVRYGKIIIEAGGQISGDMASLDVMEEASESSDGK